VFWLFKTDCMPFVHTTPVIMHCSGRKEGRNSVTSFSTMTFGWASLKCNTILTEEQTVWWYIFFDLSVLLLSDVLGQINDFLILTLNHDFPFSKSILNKESTRNNVSIFVPSVCLRKLHCSSFKHFLICKI